MNFNISMNKTNKIIVLIISLFSILSIFNLDKISAGSAIVNGVPICQSPYSESCGQGCTRQITCGPGGSFRDGECTCATPTQPQCPVATIWDGTTCKGTAAGTRDATTDQPPSAGGGNKVAAKAAKPNDPKTRQEANKQTPGGAGGGRGTTTNTSGGSSTNDNTAALCALTESGACTNSGGTWCSAYSINRCYPASLSSSVLCSAATPKEDIEAQIGSVCGMSTATGSTSANAICGYTDQSTCEQNGGRWCADEKANDGSEFAIDRCFPLSGNEDVNCNTATADGESVINVINNICAGGANATTQTTTSCDAVMANLSEDLLKSYCPTLNGDSAFSAQYGANGTNQLSCGYIASANNPQPYTLHSNSCVMNGASPSLAWPDVSGVNSTINQGLQQEGNGATGEFPVLCKAGADTDCTAGAIAITGICGVSVNGTTSYDSNTRTVYCNFSGNNRSISAEIGSCREDTSTFEPLPTHAPTALSGSICGTSSDINNTPNNGQTCTQILDAIDLVNSINDYCDGSVSCQDGSTIYRTDLRRSGNQLICDFGDRPSQVVATCNNGTLSRQNLDRNSICGTQNNAQTNTNTNSAYQDCIAQNIQPYADGSRDCPEIAQCENGFTFNATDSIRGGDTVVCTHTNGYSYNLVECPDDGSQVIISAADSSALCNYEGKDNNTKSSPFQLIKKVKAQPVPVTIDPNKLKKGVYIIEVPGYKSAEVQIISDNVKLKLFEDLNADGIQQPGEKQLDPEIYEIKLAKKEDITIYNLEAGWNLVALDFVSQKINNASNLIKEINAQGIEAVQISKYDSGNWIHFVYRKADPTNPTDTDETFGNDFTLVPGEGYFVRTLDSGTLLLKGNKFASSVPMSLESGWNLISIQALTEYTARTFLGFCNQQGIICSTLSKYANGLYSSLVIDQGITYGNDFKILKNEGYFLLVDSEGKTVKP
jgi:hypothetical protein